MALIRRRALQPASQPVAVRPLLPADIVVMGCSCPRAESKGSRLDGPTQRRSRGREGGVLARQPDGPSRQTWIALASGTSLNSEVPNPGTVQRSQPSTAPRIVRSSSARAHLVKSAQALRALH
jgi:hypothetical protein